MQALKGLGYGVSSPYNRVPEDLAGSTSTSRTRVFLFPVTGLPEDVQVSIITAQEGTLGDSSQSTVVLEVKTQDHCWIVHRCLFIFFATSDAHYRGLAAFNMLHERAQKLQFRDRYALAPVLLMM